MNNGAEEVTLAEVCDSIDYGYTASASDTPIGPRFLRITDIVPGHIDWQNVPFCEVDAPTKEKYRLRHGDVVIARTGATTGYSAYVANPPDAIFASYLVRLKVGEKADSRFISYFLKSPEFWTYMRGVLGDKSAQPNASAATMTKARLRLPPLPEQKAIAAVLGALDDKIELNRRMNSVLEAMARALFQSWFVDFDPVRAKLDGRQPIGLDPATAALFPNEFEDSEFGPIPQGWEVGKVEDILSFSRNTIDPSKFPDELFAHYSLPACDEGRVPKLETGSAIKSQKFLVPPDAILLSKLNPHIPRIWFPNITGEDRAICSTEFLVAQPKPDFSRDFLFCLFTSSPFASEYATLVTGTTGSHQRVKVENVLFMKTTIAPRALVQQFSVLTEPMFDRIVCNTRESLMLTAIRDALLPKLLSGELRTVSNV